MSWGIGAGGRTRFDDDGRAAVVDGCGDGDGIVALTRLAVAVAVVDGCGDGDGVMVLTRLARRSDLESDLRSAAFGSTVFASLALRSPALSSPVLRSPVLGSPVLGSLVLRSFFKSFLGSVHRGSENVASASAGRGRGSRPGAAGVAARFTTVEPNIGAGCGPAWRNSALVTMPQAAANASMPAIVSFGLCNRMRSTNPRSACASSAVALAPGVARQAVVRVAEHLVRH